ncbi:MAG: sensor histidine kinase [Betaproteobacteria bacterium]|nr:sensor histidine kinase [Betaproteobacteria bacterium]
MKLPLMRDSIRWRLALATAATMCVALFLTGLVLHKLFHDHVARQLAQTLEIRLDQVTAEFETDEDGMPRIEQDQLNDPLWQQPYSGLYWQVDRIQSAQQNANETGVLRSRSLWDATLAIPPDALADGRTRRHEIPGPNQQTLMALERAVYTDEFNQWRLIVAASMANLEQVEQAVAEFSGLLVLSLGVMFVLFMLAAILQIHVGLAPLRRLRAALLRIRHGKAQQLPGRYPQEVQPLVDDFNQVLSRNAEIVSRSRYQTGNLAHAIKTPLAVLQQAGELALQAPETEGLAQLLLEQVEIAGRQVNWHLARSRAIAAGAPGHATPIAPVLVSLTRAMSMVYAERGIEIDWKPPAPTTIFAGEIEDLQEMLGNLLDNACKWARSKVVIEIACQSTELIIDIGDDGPGILPEVMNAALSRGVRLDESIPGSGLGLSIVTELATLYRGRLLFSSSPNLGGLQARLVLPSVPYGTDDSANGSTVR